MVKKIDFSCSSVDDFLLVDQTIIACSVSDAYLSSIEIDYQTIDKEAQANNLQV